ncbi:hypothetical protein HGRIS_000428 [Hohenbuehelia grisea]|uniref:Scavenger mRNA decapping enzyme n=1 Tax=Hohenbuehelia grisea TaxID=104357 RepID=A0ABR3JR71_9AGAR
MSIQTLERNISLDDLRSFVFEKVLNEDPVAKSITLLGTFQSNAFGSIDDTKTAVVRIEKTALDPEEAKRAFRPATGLVQKVNLVESNDIYHWLLGWFGIDRERDVKINIVCPATEMHIKKYTAQEITMVHETPELYETVVKPYITAFPPSRTQWVDDILSGKSEADKALVNCPQFILIPDMKWDLTTLSALYLLAIVRDGSLRSLRDLNKGKGHWELLKKIREEAWNVVKDRFGLERGRVRMFVHYQPSYYHFHVHIVHADQAGMHGMNVGQAHLLDDIIAMLELDPDEGPGIFQRITLTYGLGDQHGLYEPLVKSNVT